MRGGPLGRGWHLGSDVSIYERPDGNVVLNSGEGYIDVFTSNGSGGYTSPLGASLTLQKLGTGNFTLTDKKQNILTFQNNKVSAATDINSNTTTYTYSNGRLVSVTDAAGRSITYDYNSDNLLVAIHDPVGNTYSFSYDTYIGGVYDRFNWQLSTITDPLNNIISLDTLVYDCLQFTDSLNRSTEFDMAYSQYSVGQLQYVKDARNSYNYQTNFSQAIEANQIVTIVTYPGNRIYKYYHNPNTGNLLSAKDPLNKTTSYTYDGNSNIISQIDALGRVTSVSYDTNGNITGQTDPLNHAISYTYNSNNNLLSTTDALGHVTSNTYDSNGNILTDGNNTYTYDSNGTVHTVKDANNNISTYSYNSNGNVSSITDAVGKATSFTYNSLSQKLTETDASGNTTSYITWVGC